MRMVPDGRKSGMSLPAPNSFLIDKVFLVISLLEKSIIAKI